MKPFDDADHGYEVTDIPISLIDRYPDHPFYVDDDDDMLDLAASIEAVGQLTPASVRPKKNGRYSMDDVVRMSGWDEMTVRKLFYDVRFPSQHFGRAPLVEAHALISFFMELHVQRKEKEAMADLGLCIR